MSSMQKALESSNAAATKTIVRVDADMGNGTIATAKVELPPLPAIAVGTDAKDIEISLKVAANAEELPALKPGHGVISPFFNFLDRSIGQWRSLILEQHVVRPWLCHSGGLCGTWGRFSVVDGTVMRCECVCSSFAHTHRPH